MDMDMDRGREIVLVGLEVIMGEEVCDDSSQSKEMVLEYLSGSFMT